jgi:hypothetical protein
MTNSFSIRIFSARLLAAAALTLMVSPSFAAVPGTPSIQLHSPTPTISNLAAQSECLGGPSDPALVPPCSTPYGHTYSE